MTACISGITALPKLLKSEQLVTFQESDFRISIPRVNSDFFTRDLQHANLLLILCFETNQHSLAINYPVIFMKSTLKISARFISITSHSLLNTDDP